MVAVLIGVLTLGGTAAAQAPLVANLDPLTGPRSRLAKDWVGLAPLPNTTPILVLAGHADSQGIGGAGTAGAAVDLTGAAPMQPGLRDELHWNLLTAQAVVALGQRRGLAIRFYDPPLRTIADGDDPRTNWSVGKAHAEAGGYALEIHYDAYGPDGVGSGLIPPLHRPPSRLDESLALAFGPYPLLYREGLGAPKRGIAILEIGKLEGALEAALRDPIRRQATLEAIAVRVVNALEQGLGRSPGAPMAAANPAALTPPPDGERTGRPERRRSTRPGAW
ncbi:dehydrogenase [Cyanobium sp. T1B-Tous]|uniref:dehydrogenase n=1 Tax=Cyanobium sp. T1B-Tous TaxID=2823721 RepID=UPI0020CB7BA0|nr:dehydrogenase [Cyanobium sp. T1B-Tous]